MINVKLMKCGGILPGMEVDEKALAELTEVNYTIKPS